MLSIQENEISSAGNKNRAATRIEMIARRLTATAAPSLAMSLLIILIINEERDNTHQNLIYEVGNFSNSQLQHS